jgi:hypothetical protein
MDKKLNVTHENSPERADDIALGENYVPANPAVEKYQEELVKFFQAALDHIKISAEISAEKRRSVIPGIQDASRKLIDASEKITSPIGRFTLQKVSIALNYLVDDILHANDNVTQWDQKIQNMELSIQKFAPKQLQEELYPVFSGIREYFGMDASESKLAEISATENHDTGNRPCPSPFD